MEEETAMTYEIDMQTKLWLRELEKKLGTIDYAYDEKANQFI